MSRFMVMTTHAMDRMIERGGKLTAHLKKIGDIRERRKAALELAKGAKENRAFLNNTLFMTNILARYGFDKRFAVYILEKLVFIAVEDEEGSHIIVTTIDQRTSYVPQIRHA